MSLVKKRLKPEKYKSINPRLLYSAFEILKRPLSTSFLIYLLSSNIIYADGPPILKTFVYFFLLIPVMIILPIVTVKQLNIYIYGLGIIYLMTLFLRLHLLNQELQHLIFLGLIAISILGILRFVKRSIMIRIFQSNFSRSVVVTMFYTFGILLVIAFFAILIGYYTLGIFLFNNTIWSIYRFFLFYAAYVVLEGFIQLLVNSDYMLKINTIKKNKKDAILWRNSPYYVIGNGDLIL